MKEDAVAPVIAAMLVLAVIVTFFSAWNAVILPSMKEQAEVTHLHEVEESFARFSSDIDTASSLNTDMTLSEHLPLGGGDVAFNSLKSGGTLKARTEPSQYMSLAIGLVDPPSSFWYANYSYQPVGNFWMDQGYDWSYGYINVTKGNLATPLEATNMTTISFNSANSLLRFEPIQSNTDPRNCSGIIVNTVNITADPDHMSTSGNGIGTLVLTSSQRPGKNYVKPADIRIFIAGDMTSHGFPSAFKDYVTTKSEDLGIQCLNIHPVKTDDGVDLQIDDLQDVTVIRKITEIRIGTV